MPPVTAETPFPNQITLRYNASLVQISNGTKYATGSWVRSLHAYKRGPSVKQIRLITAVVFLVVSSASATVFQPVNDRQLADRSEAVVVASVIDASSRLRADGYVVTDYRLAVEKTIKGTAAGTIIVSEIGGVAGQRFTFISDSAAYTPGERVMVFLKKRDDGTYFTTSMAMGKFSFTRNASGDAVVTRDVSELRDDPPRKADAFEGFVRSGKSEAYTTTLTPIASALHPIALFSASAYAVSACGSPGCFPVRVAGGEAGGGLAFYSTGSLPGIDGPGGISNAAATWTGDPDSFISLSYAGTFVSSGPDGDDGHSTVYLGKTVPGLTFCDGSMACTIGSGNFTHSYKGETFIGITDADIVVGPNTNSAQFAVLILHELGHGIGFRHSDQGTPSTSDAVMNSSVSATIGGLRQWDRDALSTVYGNGPACVTPTSVSIFGGGAVTSGQSATLTAAVSGGNGTFSYNWFEGSPNDISQPRGTNSSTFVTPAITTGSKTYWVKAFNTCGTVSAQTTVFVQENTCTAPSIISQPTPQTISSGATATLSVLAGGSQPLIYQWFQGSTVVGTNSPSFTTPALTQAASYFVRVTNACGSATSNTVAVSIAGTCTRPSFSIQPAGGNVVAGSSSYLIAFATGATSYQWFRGNAGDISNPVGGDGPSNERWVKQVFIDLLGRNPDAAAVASYAALLSGGASRTSVATTILSSAEYRSRLVTEFYSTLLHRSPSAAEIAFWLPAFTSGLTDQQVAAQIVASPEYFALAGSTNAGWINRIFLDVLGRAPSASDISNYSALLGSNSRTVIGLSIINSSEAANRRVQQYFTRFLRRGPSASDAASFTAAIVAGTSDEAVMAQILAADEYFNYGTVLFTDPISATTSYWVRAFNTCGSTDSSVGTVTIPQCTRPVISTQPQNVTINVGDPFSVSVVASGATSYQWFRASSGDPTNPVTGATGPVLATSLNNAGVTNFWVRVTNACGDTNSSTVTVTTICGPRVLTLSVPPTAPSASTYTVSWNGNSQLDTQYELQEATKSDFSDAQTFTGNLSSRNFSHTVTTDTRYYYRVHAAPICGGNFGTYSPTSSVLVVAPPAPTQSTFDFAQLPCTAGNCIITQSIFIPGLGSPGTFSVTTDEPFVTITPSSGVLPADGTTVTATIDTARLELGATQATLTINRAFAASKMGILGDPPPITVPVSVSVVAPVTPKAKDPNAPLNALLIPAIAHADGIGTRFVSDVRLTNTSTQSITYQLTYTPSNTDGTMTGKQVSFSVNAGDTKALNDIVKDWYGSGTQGEAGIGSLEIRPLNYAGKDPVSVSLATVAASRTYSVTSVGTFGQFIPALPLLNFLGKSEAAKISLQQVSQSSTNSGFRTNLGFVEGSGQPVNFVATLFDDAGRTLAERSYSLKPYESQQIKLDSFFNVNGVTLPNVADGRVEVKVTSDSGRVTAYASVLDNTTTDPLLVFPADPSKISAKRFVVPGVAEFDNGFSNFHTDMRLYNGGSSPVDVTLAFTGASVANKVKTIAVGETLAIDNVLPTLWNITGGGSVVATTANDAQLVVTARTFSRDKVTGGTFGQFIPGVTTTDAVGNGERTLQIVQLEESPAFRTNLGLVEVTGNSATVELLAYTPDSKVAARTIVPLGAGEYLQKGGIFKSLGFSNVYNGRITAKVISGNGRVAAYGSVIDNRTTDPTYVPSQ